MDEEYLPVRIKPPPRAEVLFSMARNKAFPLCILELEEKKGDIDDPVVKVQVHSSIFEVLKKFFKSERITLYCSLNEDNSEATIGAFTYDLIRAYQFLVDLGAVKPLDTWVKEAQKSIEREITKK